MKIYTDRGGTAPSPRRVRIFLAEKGLDVPYVRLELHKENRTPEFREKNPFYNLPVLEFDDGTCIAESIAICRYFEELHPEPSLCGSTPREKAEIEMWMRRVEQRLYIAIELSSEDVLPKEAAARFRKGALRMLDFLDQRLAQSEFIAGSRYTIADVYALSAIDFGVNHLAYEIPAQLEHFTRWHRAVSSRPSATA